MIGFERMTLPFGEPEVDVEHLVLLKDKSELEDLRQLCQILKDVLVQNSVNFLKDRLGYVVDKTTLNKSAKSNPAQNKLAEAAAIRNQRRLL